MKYFLIALRFGFALLNGYKKDPTSPLPSPVPSDVRRGIYVLNEGVYSISPTTGRPA